MSALDPYKDAAQQMVTALLQDNRSLALSIAEDAEYPKALALVLADLCAFTHHRWSESLGIDRAEAWSELMLDVAEWREARR